MTLLRTSPPTTTARARRSHQDWSTLTWSPVMIIEWDTSPPTATERPEAVTTFAALASPQIFVRSALSASSSSSSFELDLERPERVLVLGALGDLLDRLLGGRLRLDPGLELLPELLRVGRSLLADHVGGPSRNLLPRLHDVRQERREKAGQGCDLHWRPPDASEGVFCVKQRVFLTPRGRSRSVAAPVREVTSVPSSASREDQRQDQPGPPPRGRSSSRSSSAISR